jgi:hypothetical protein
MNGFQLIVVPSVCAIVATILVGTVRRSVPRRSGILWAVLWSTAAVLIVFPNATAILARGVGIGRGADLVLYGTTLAGLGACLYFYRRYRHLEEMVTALMRREALRDARYGGFSAQASVSKSDLAKHKEALEGTGWREG